MCLAKAYLQEKGEKELFIQEVALVEIENKKLILSTIFGEQKEIEANIRQIDFQNSNVILERTD